MRGTIARVFNKFTIQGKISSYQNLDKTTVLEIFQMINEKGASVGARVEHIQWDGLQLFGLGEKDPSNGWQNLLPRTINEFGISYIWGKQATKEYVVRFKLPSSDGKVMDDSRYLQNDLRPGVMLGGFDHDGNSRLSMTSGVCVQSLDGAKYITVAQHGFKGPGVGLIGQPVYQPMAELGPNGQTINQIGVISKVIGDEDIALATLRPGIKYSAETFSVAGEPPVRAFRNLKNPKELKQGDTVYLNTPVNGLCEGVHLKTDHHLLEGKSLNLETANYTYFGNGSEEFFVGCCGGVLWDDNFDVLGHFRYQNTEDKFVYGPTFEALREAGYRLSSI
jgi:hypothetical protein